MAPDEQAVQAIHDRYQSQIRDVLHILDELENHSLSDKLNRIVLARDLAHFRSSLITLAKTVVDAYYVSFRVPEYIDLNTPLGVAWLTTKAISGAFGSSGRDLQSIAERANSLGKFLVSEVGRRDQDDQARETLYSLLSDAKKEIMVRDIQTSAAVDPSQGYPLVLIDRLNSQLARSWLALGPLWSVAACHLAAFEVTVNDADRRWRKDIGAGSEDESEFKSRLRRVADCMKAAGYPVESIEQGVLEDLYKLRGRVLHSGHVPTPTELAYVLRIVPRFVNDLGQALRRTGSK